MWYIVIIILLVFDEKSFDLRKDYFVWQNKQVPFRMAIGNEELMRECFLQHLRTGTARMKKDKKTEEEASTSSTFFERKKLPRREA